MTKTKDTKDLSFEDAVKELDDIVKKLEAGEASLDESITLYERGVALRKHCESQLDAAHKKIEKITQDANGNISTTPLDAE